MRRCLGPFRVTIVAALLATVSVRSRCLATIRTRHLRLAPRRSDLLHAGRNTLPSLGTTGTAAPPRPIHDLAQVLPLAPDDCVLPHRPLRLRRLLFIPLSRPDVRLPSCRAALIRSVPRLPSSSASATSRPLLCDGAAGDALEATRLRRVLHCVPALRVPQASARHGSAHAGGGWASAGSTKGPVTWLPSDP